MGDKVEIRFKLEIICYNIMINYQLTFKTVEFIYLTINLMKSNSILCFSG